MDQQPQNPSEQPPTVYSPSPLASQSQPPQYTAPIMSPVVPPPAKKNRTKLLLIMALIVLIAAGTGAYAFSQHDKKQNAEIGGSVSLNSSPATTSACIPIVATTLDSSSLQTTYQRFVKAIATKNQSCANDLSTNYFLSAQKQIFSTPNWIVYKVPGQESLADDFSQLPTTLDPTLFTQTDYTRGTIAGSSDQTSATGTTMSYPIDLSKYTGDSQKQQASVSIVLDNGSVKVDNVEIDPPQQGD